MQQEKHLVGDEVLEIELVKWLRFLTMEATDLASLDDELKVSTEAFVGPSQWLLLCRSSTPERSSDRRLNRCGQEKMELEAKRGCNILRCPSLGTAHEMITAR